MMRVVGEAIIDTSRYIEEVERLLVKGFVIFYADIDLLKELLLSSYKEEYEDIVLFIAGLVNIFMAITSRRI